MNSVVLTLSAELKFMAMAEHIVRMRSQARLMSAEELLHNDPDLVVEILSTSARPSAVLEKVASWLEAGTRLVWILDPERGIARVHRADGTIDIVRLDGALDGEDVLPGFSCTLGEVLA